MPIHAHNPQAGYYETRLVRKGPRVPARIWISAGQPYCKIGDKQVDPFANWPYLAAKPITVEEYRRLANAAGISSETTAAVPRRLSDMKPPF